MNKTETADEAGEQERLEQEAYAAVERFRCGQIDRGAMQRAWQAAFGPERQTKAIMLRLDRRQYLTVKREADAAGLSMNAWILSACGLS